MGLRHYLRRLRFGTDLPYRLYDRLTFLLRQVGPYHPVRRPPDDGRSAPFFIVGSGRSGNTLLRAILAGHPEFAIPPESYMLGMAVRDYRTFGFLPWPTLLRIVLGRFQFYPHFDAWETALRPVYQDLLEYPPEERSLAGLLDAVYRAYARRHMPDAIRWGDKTPMNVYHLPRIDAVFPDAIWIHMIRDGRDVVASYLEAGLYDSTREACGRWLESVELVRQFSRDLPPERYTEVRYEHLVRNPEVVIRSVCDRLGVSFEPRMLRHRERVQDLGDADLGHHSNLSRPISDRSVGSWRSRLNHDQKREIRARLRSLLGELGYLD